MTIRHARFACVVAGMMLAVAVQAQDSQDSFQVPQGGGAAIGQSPIAGPQTRARVHTELAAEWFRLGNFAVALDEVAIALAAVSNYVPALSIQGLVHIELKEFDKAEKALRRALDLAPKDPGVIHNYGWFLCQSGSARQSITYFLDAVKHPLYPTPELAYYNAGVCALKSGDLDGAEGYLLSSLRLSRDKGLAPRLQLAMLSYRRGQFEAARRQAAELLKVAEEPPPELLWLALRIERKLGDRAAEGNLAVQLRNRYPNSPEYQEFLKGNFE